MKKRGSPKAGFPSKVLAQLSTTGTRKTYGSQASSLLDLPQTTNGANHTNVVAVVVVVVVAIVVLVIVVVAVVVVSVVVVVVIVVAVAVVVVAAAAKRIIFLCPSHENRQEEGRHSSTQS